MFDHPVFRRIIGLASLVLVLGLSYLGIEYVTAPPAGSYTVTAVLGRAGSGLNVGTDVKVRGARIGSVESVDYRDGQATAVLRLEDDPPLPPPDQLELVVTAKTFLGEKQVEIGFPDEAFGARPALAAGDTIVADRQPTEVSDVLDAMEPFLDAIDPADLAIIVDALGAQQGQGPAIAENLELSQQLAAFGERTAQRQLQQLGEVADVAGALADRTDDLARLSRSLPRSVTLIADRQAAFRANLDALSRFAVGFAEFLEVEEPTIDELLRGGDPIGAVFERRIDEVGEIVYGLYRYAYKLGHHGGQLTDGTEYAFFRINVNLEDLFAGFCAEGGEFAQQVPVCGGGS